MTVKSSFPFSAETTLPEYDLKNKCYKGDLSRKKFIEKNGNLRHRASHRCFMKQYQ